jgi:preprotein translocase subunit SecA
MRIFGGEQVANLMTRLGVDENVPIEARLVSKSIENAQKKVEGHNFDIRKRLVEYDDVMNRQREIVYRLRCRVLTPTSPTAPFKTWFLEKTAFYVENAEKQWQAREKEIGAELFEKVVRQIALQTIDVLWIEHLDTLDDLRQGIGLRGYAAKDPLVEYKREAREMFERLMNEIWGSIAERISRVELRHAPHPPFPSQPSRLTYRRPEVELGVRQEAAEIQKPVVTGEKPGRNDPCPCGKINPKTGKPVKYKHCCYPKYG